MKRTSNSSSAVIRKDLSISRSSDSSIELMGETGPHTREAVIGVTQITVKKNSGVASKERTAAKAGIHAPEYRLTTKAGSTESSSTEKEVFRWHYINAAQQRVYLKSEANTRAREDGGMDYQVLPVISVMLLSRVPK